MDYLPFSSKIREHGLIGLKHFLFFLSYRATRETDRHFSQLQEYGSGSKWRAFFKFQYADKGVMGLGVHFLDFYHYLCHQW